MNNTKVIRKGTPYPYPIAEVECPPDPVLKRTDPWLILEFFRVEALLRSPAVQQLYRIARPDNVTTSSEAEDTSFSVFSRYGISWGLINGDHHQLLSNPHPAPFRPSWWLLPAGQPEALTRAGITDVGASIKEGHSEFWNLAMNSETPQYMYLAIDTAFPPDMILKALKPVLKARNKLMWDPEGIWRAATESTIVHRGVESDYVLPHGPRKKNAPILNVKAWLKYFRCYDLRHCQQMSFGTIGKRVYGASEGRSGLAVKKRQSVYDQAERAYKKVKKLIECAEKGNWPPPRF